ncbi:MAG: putative TrmH family tRNA/rRNA methyltransferase [Elusimicrobia bacterium]|nr:putative TrmH family tRNA/rRNA methyltransferase [Elusimicrobiota bacterium]
MSNETDLVYGRWPVREALEAGQVGKLFLARGVSGGPIQEILALAQSKKVPFHWIERRKLEEMAGFGAVHQGVAAQVSPIRFHELDSLLDLAKRHRGAGPGLLFLDGVVDPHNLGSILRSAVFFGVSGVVIPKWRAAGVTATVVRSSAGAARLIPICQVANLAQSLESAKKAGIWVVGADMAGEDVKKADVPQPFALVMGGEGEGLHVLIKKKCDLLVALQGHPERKGIDSLNVGSAAAALLHALIH